MEEALVDPDAGRQDGRAPACSEAFEQLGIGGELRTSVDSQGFRGSGDQAEQSDVGVGQDVLVSVGELVSGAIGNHDRLVVLDQDESRCVALR